MRIFKDRTFLVTAFFLLIVIGSLAYFLFMNPKVKKSSQPQESLQSQSVVPSPKDFVLKIGQQSAGITAIVDYLEMPKTGWLVIHNDEGGKPGKILGEGIPAANFGVYEKIIFILRDSLISGKSYFAMIHIDDGDLKFSETDKPATNAKGETVMQGFSVKND